MGLDNGICVRRTDYTDKIKELEKFGHSWDTAKEYDFEFTYWRKCWNIRNDIFNILKKDDNEYSYELSFKDVKNIIKLLKSYNKKTWIYGTWFGSIWEWKDYKPIIDKHIKNLNQLLKLMKVYPYPKFKVYFYDSY